MVKAVGTITPAPESPTPEEKLKAAQDDIRLKLNHMKALLREIREIKNNVIRENM